VGLTGRPPLREPVPARARSLEPVALGGRSTIENIRLACKGHNIHAGIQTLGLETMAPHLGKFTDPSGSHDQ
jgi:hypothetical protein